MISQTLTRTEAPPQIAAPIILPLFMPSGKPYWYIPTERFTQTIEQLNVGPSPSAIAQEAYYSSALDGAVEYANHAQQALMYALQSPQVSALQSSQASAFQSPQVSAQQCPQTPIDAAFVETVAFLLSGTRTGFRATEISGTPHPSTISWHMEQLYRFISDDRYHPLIRSAVCHSFVLTVQPYNNCSGRLARLLAMMILLRSGYTFLLNASYSAVIVQRGNDYARAFHGIFSSNNPYGQAGNQTGFVEFLLDVLAEALETARRESAVKPPVVATTVDDKPNITSGREDEIRSKSPLVRRTAASEIVENKPEITSGREDKNRSKPPLVRRTVVSEIVEDKPDVNSGKEDNHDGGVDDFEGRLAKLDANESPLVRRTAAVVREMLCSNIYEFTRSDWYDRTGMTFKEYDACRNTLKRYHLVRSIGRSTSNGKSRVVYRFTKENTSDDEEDDYQRAQLDEQAAFDESPGAVEQTWDLPILAEMERSRFESVRNTAAYYRSFLQRGATEFTKEEWIEQTGQSLRDFHKSYEILSKRHLIDCVEKKGRYRLTPECEAHLPPSAFWTRLEALEHSKSANVRKGAATVRKLIEEGYTGFTSQQWEKKTGMLLIEFATIRNRLFENQLIVNENKGTAIREAFYRFTLDGINIDFDTQSTHGKEDDTADEQGNEISAMDTQQNFIRHLNDLSFNRSELVKRGAEIIRAMISEGTMSFTRLEWMKRANMTEREYATCRSAMATRGMIRRLPKDNREPVSYTFNWPAGALLPEPSVSEIQKRCIKEVKYSTVFNQLAPLVPIEDFPKKALSAMTGSTHHITESEWAAVNHLSSEDATRDMNILLYMGIVTRRYYQRLNAFSYHVLRPEKLEQMLKDGLIKPAKEYDNLPFWVSLSYLAGMKSSITRQAAVTVREMYNAGVFYFTPGSWVRRTGMNKNQFAGCVKVMESQRVVTEDGPLFRLTIAPKGTPIDYCELIGIEKTVSEAQIDRIKTYASCAKKDYDKRIGAFLLEQINAGSCYFTKREYETYANQFSTTTIVKDMLRARRLGLIRRYLALGTVVYAISSGLDGQTFSDPSYEASANVEERNYCPTLTPFRKRRLTGIYNTFGTHEFTRREYEEAFHITDARQTLIPLVGLNLITERQSQGRYLYSLAIKPEERPECFNPSLKEEIVNPIQTFSVRKHEGAELKQKGSAQKHEGAELKEKGSAQKQEGDGLAVQQRRRRIKSATEATEEHEIKLAKKRDAYATQPPEKLEAMRAKMRARARARLASESPEEREKRLSKEQERRRMIKATETPEEHEKKLAAKRAYYAAQPQEKLEARRAHMREQARARRVAETPAEREIRLAAEQEQRHRKWAAETPEEREKRLAENREYQRKKRAKKNKTKGGAHDTGLHTRPGIHK